MLAYSLQHFDDANFAVSQYFNVALQQHHTAQQLLRQVFPDDWHRRKVLDFACGYGRHVRFLVLAHPPAQVWASEIQQDAVAYVAHEFGVHGLASQVDPEQFVTPYRFDFIWVASLFSHLPEARFHGWLKRLIELLAPGGVLCFSVHDVSVAPPNVDIPGSGIAFFRMSEIDELDRDVYGTTYVTPEFVRKAANGAAGDSCACLRFPRALANQQDLYVVTKESNPVLQRLSLRKGAWGWADIVKLSRNGELNVIGWAASLDHGRLGVVEIRIDDRIHECPIDMAREDVNRAIGWEGPMGFSFTTVNCSREIFLEVSASSESTEPALIYAGALRSPAA